MSVWHPSEYGRMSLCIASEPVSNPARRSSRERRWTRLQVRRPRCQSAHGLETGKVTSMFGHARSHRAAWQGDRSIPVASPGRRAFRPWTLTKAGLRAPCGTPDRGFHPGPTKGAFVLPVEPMTAGSAAASTEGQSCPLEPRPRLLLALGTRASIVLDPPRATPLGPACIQA